MPMDGDVEMVIVDSFGYPLPKGISRRTAAPAANKKYHLGNLGKVLTGHPRNEIFEVKIRN